MSNLCELTNTISVMGVIKKLNKWANRHTYLPLDLVRIALGAFLFIKGFQFIGNTQVLYDMVEPVESLAGGMIIIHYVAPAHLIGGLLIIFGLLTRWAALAQLPILIGAVIVNASGGASNMSMLIAVITLLLCLFFSIYGSGKRSADYYLKMQQ